MKGLTMPRELTDEHIRKMQDARVQAREEKKEAVEVVQNNPQLGNSKFWKAIDFDKIVAIKNAIEEYLSSQKLDRIRELEKELEDLKREL